MIHEFVQDTKYLLATTKKLKNLQKRSNFDFC